jgi:tetratricopeptide (TPR) repeat protein/predicted Ser/Thr protein kinase
MTCGNCGRQNPQAADRCAGCGTPLGPVTGSGEGPVFDLPTRIEAGPPGAGPTPKLAAGTSLGSRYEIQSVLGEGGMGTVYKAHDRELGRTVALKVIRSDMASRPEVLERFKREILLASQVTHKNVLRVHDLGAVGDVRFISMSYVEGSNLKVLLDREGPLPLDRALPLVRQIGEALEAAHEAGVVHRDLKPQNILIDTDGNAYIADFGISRSLDAGGTMTETGMILGTVDYMSPEQARGETPDHRGDIYSFGVMLYEIFTGTLPFRSSNTLSIMMKRIHEDAPTVRQARPEVPAWLSAIVARSLRRDPEMRYQSVADLLRDLERRRASIAWRRGLLRVGVPSLAAAVVLAGAGYWLLERMRARGAADGSTLTPAQAVAFLPFENGTGSPTLDWTRTGFPDLVANGLREARDLRLLGGDRTQQTLEDLKLPLTGTYSAIDLRRAGSVLGADVLVSGVLRRGGEHFVAEARLQRPGLQGMQEIGREQAEGDGEGSIFTIAEALAGKIGKALKVRASPAGGASRASTRSVEALRLYSEGLGLSRAGRDIDAAARLEQAIAADPAFALAQALMSRTYGRLGRRDRALAASDQAIKNLAGVTAHEARLIRARHAVLQDRQDQGIAEYRELLRAYPQDTDARFELATVLEQKGDLAAATEELQTCVSLDPKNMQARYVLGRLRLRQGDTEGALAIFNDLLASYTQNGNEEGKGNALLALGNVRMQAGAYAEALDDYQKSLDIRTRIDDRRGMAAALGNIAQVLQNQGRYDEAIRSAKSALDLNVQIQDRQGIANEWTKLGEIYEFAGKIVEARDCYQESLKIGRDLDDPALLGRNLGSLGFVSSVLGDYVQAYYFFQEALGKRREIGDKREILRSLIDLGLMEQMQGRYDKALTYAAEAMDLVRETGEKAGGVVISTNVGMLHDEQGSYAAALDSLKQAVEGARAIDDKYYLASSLLHLGRTLVHVGDIAEAQKTLDEAERLVTETGNAALLPEVLNEQAEIQAARGEMDNSLRTLANALAKAEALGDRRLVILSRFNLGKQEMAAGRAPGRARLRSAADEAGKISLLPLRLRALAGLAAAGTGKSIPDPGAVSAAEQVVGEGTALNLREGLFVASWVLARRARFKGDHQDATRMFLQAGQAVREMAEGLGEPYLTSLAGRPDLRRLKDEAREHITRHGGPEDKETATTLFARPTT